MLTLKGKYLGNDTYTKKDGTLVNQAVVQTDEPKLGDCTRVQVEKPLSAKLGEEVVIEGILITQGKNGLWVRKK